jgi:hypothetical protein
MNWYKIIKQIPDLPRYEIGDEIPLYRGNKGQLLYHIWTTIIEVSKDCVKIID